jgi:DNA-binding XRE family transcriptional regulator
MTGSNCGKEVGEARVLPRYIPKNLGIGGIVLLNAVSERRCEHCGSVESISIPNLNGLMASIAACRISLPTKLNGTEWRFFRQVIDHTATELARRLDIRKEAISRIENSAEPAGPHLEIRFRIYVYFRVRRFTRIKVDLEALLMMPLRMSAHPETPVTMRFVLRVVPPKKLTARPTRPAYVEARVGRSEAA